MLLAGASPLLALDDEAGSETGCIRLASYTDLPMFHAINKPIQELYEEAGLCVDIRYVPIQRAHGMQMQGRVHGQIGRADAWLDQYGDDVVALSQPILKLDGMLAHTGMTSHADASMDMTGRTVAFRPAVAWCSSWVERNAVTPLPVRDFNDAGALLDSGRADYLLYVSFAKLPMPTLDPAAYHFDKVDDVLIYHVLDKDMGHIVSILDEAMARLGGAAYFEQYLAAQLKAGGR